MEAGGNQHQAFEKRIRELKVRKVKPINWKRHENNIYVLKARRSTRSVVPGKAKVMSYEDLEEARAKRAAREKTFLGEGKRGRKRKKSCARGWCNRTSGADKRSTRAIEGPNGTNILGRR
jgi:hypothetical protein